MQLSHMQLQDLPRNQSCAKFRIEESGLSVCIYDHILYNCIYFVLLFCLSFCCLTNFKNFKTFSELSKNNYLDIHLDKF